MKHAKQNKHKKILVLASTFPRWKNDTTPPFIFELEKRLTKDFDIHILAPHHKNAKKYEELEGLKIYRFQYFWPSKFQRLCYEGGILPNIKRNKFLMVQGFTLVFFELVSAIKILKKEKINLIHAHWIIPQGIVALLINKLFKIPYIITTHGGDIFGLQSPLLKQLKKSILKNASKITVVSNAIKEEILNKIDPNLNIEVISMGVDSKLFNPKKYDKTIKEKYNIGGPFLLFVGRLAEKKGVKYLIEAMPKIVLKFPKTKLLIIGEGTLEEELKSLTNDLNLQNNIIFLGAIPNKDLPKYYATADIFIGPSIKVKDGDTEGFGLTFAEASFSGCIPIGTDVGGISDIIKNRENGYLIKQKNSDAIAKVVIKILNNKKISANIKKLLIPSLVNRFDWKNIKNQYQFLY